MSGDVSGRDSRQRPDGPAVRAYDGRLTEVGRLVDGRVTRLMAGLASGGASAAASLAQLRAAVDREPGTVPAIWGLTIDGVPGRPVDDEPTAQERAVHAALTLFAVHQQARPQPMHQRGVGFGQAVARLEAQLLGPQARQSGHVSAVRRRFDAIATATTFPEAVHHLRGVVTQLRTASPPVPLDYGQLADDLFALQHPARVRSVRLRWARQYYRIDNALSPEVGPHETQATESRPADKEQES